MIGLKVVCYCMIFLVGLAGDICWCKEMEPTETSIILNTLRKSIESGEFRIISTRLNVRPIESIMSIEEIKAALNEVWIPNELGYEDEILDYMRKKEWVTQTEELICFEVNTGSSILNFDRYRVISFDRRPLNPLKGVGRYMGAGGCRIDTYDGQTGSLETDSQFMKSEIYLNDSPTINVLSYHLFGRSQKYIPHDAQVNLTLKSVDNDTLYEVKFSTQDTSVKLLIDPDLEFAVLSEKHLIDNRLVFSASYKDFKKVNSIYFPTSIQIELYNSLGLKHRYKLEVEEMSFNVAFPSDFFEVQRSISPEQRLMPFSPIKPNSRTEQRQRRQTQKAPLPMCGPLSLQFVCKAFNVNAKLDELLNLTDYREDIGTSMKGLYEAAWRKGLNPEGILLKSKRLDDVRLPAIAHVDTNHFVVITAASRKDVRIFDPASDDYTLPIQEFRERWDGSLLTFTPTLESTLPSNSDASSPQPDSYSSALRPIQVDKSIHDFGRVRGGEQVEHIFTITNVGKMALEVSEVDKSCACTTTFLSNPTILPDGKLQLKVRLDAPKRDGTVEQFVRFQTDDPNLQTFELKVRANVYLSLKAMPSRVYLGKISADTPVTRTIVLEYSPKSVQILGIRTSSDVIHAVLLEGEQILQIHAKLQTVGLISEKIFVDYREQDEKLFLEVPIHGQITGEFEVSSKNIFFGLVDSQASNLSRDIVIKVTKPNIRVLHAESQSNYVSTSLTQLKDGRAYNVRIALQPSGHTGGLLKDVITISTNSDRQKELKVPVFAQITISE